MPVDKGTRRLAYDTRALPSEALTSEEMKILCDINGLLRQVWDEGRRLDKLDRPKRELDRAKSERFNKSPWASPEPDRRNHIIMIAGERGTGKTSLLLTLLAGWNTPEDFDGDRPDPVFKEMENIVRALWPIDFDPLPPELPIFNWVIQAFEPLVRKVSGQRPDRFMEPQESDQIDDTLTGRYRKLQNAAAVGWTTGLLKQSLGKDVGEFLLWQGEQQGNWQRLQFEWQEFLSKLMKELEEQDGGLLPKGGIIVLPIDDLDLQVARTRELLLTLLVLRHERVVYLLTGEIYGTDVALKADFQRDFLQGLSSIGEGFQDVITEHTSGLGQKLREKSIPNSHTFHLGGHSISGAMSWQPISDKTRGRDETLGKVLDRLWAEEGIAPNFTESSKATFSEFLKDRATNEDKNVLPFRELQTFFDRWVNDTEPDGIGIMEFLRIVVERPKEEALRVGRPTTGEGPIEFTTTAPGLLVPAPEFVALTRSPGGSGSIAIKSAKQWDFVRKAINVPKADTDAREEDANTREKRFESAVPAELLLLDLVAWNPSRFQIVSADTRLTNEPLGLVWTEIYVASPSGHIVVDWPMGKVPDSPSAWIKMSSKWSERLNDHSKDPSDPGEEELLKAWCAFVSEKDSQPGGSLKAHLKLLEKAVGRDAVVAFASVLFGFSGDLRRRIREAVSPLPDSSAPNSRTKRTIRVGATEAKTKQLPSDDDANNAAMKRAVFCRSNLRQLHKYDLAFARVSSNPADEKIIWTRLSELDGTGA